MKRRSAEKQNTEYELNYGTIDEIAGAVVYFLKNLGMERANIIRIRLSLEEALLRWQDHFGEGAKLRFMTGTSLFRPFLRLELQGEACDPLHSSEADLGNWADSLLSDIGFSPKYSYHRGVNVVELNLSRPKWDPALMLLFAMALGIGLGIFTEYVLPDATRDQVLYSVLDPFYDAFARLLNSAAGPMVFLSVLASVCGIGESSSVEDHGRRLIGKLLLKSGLLCLIAMLISLLLFNVFFSRLPVDAHKVGGFLDTVLNLLPGDLITPFIDGNSPQIIVLALALGYAMLAVGSGASTLRHLFQELEAVCIVITNWVSMLTPLFLVVIITLGILDGSSRMLLSIWKPLLAASAIIVAVGALGICRVASREQIPVMQLVRKLWPSFRTAFRTASVNASYGENMLCCERQLGVDPELNASILPMGLVVYMPAGTIATIVTTVFAASWSRTPINPVWMVSALFLVTTIQAASPPVAAAALWGYAAIFSRLGINSVELTLAIAADVLFGFITSPFNQLMLQLEMVVLADKAGKLNREVLRK